MHIITHPSDMAALRTQWLQENAQASIALVPTMGALHRGHGALCNLAKANADRVVVSIFVNPLQFGANEDLDRYPRPKEADLEQCRAWGVDAVYYPGMEAIYPNGMEHTTQVLPPEAITDRLCGAARPGHFTGVATVVLILLNHVRPTLAVFGEKDAQQVMVIRRMVADLGVPVHLLIHPVVREASGLALSSRNQYLRSAPQQEAAILLSRILKAVQKKSLSAPAGSLPTRDTLWQTAEDVIAVWRQGPQAAHVHWRIQYLEAVDEESLESAETLGPGVRLLIAAYVDEVRLIDTLLIEEEMPQKR
jgi:pantoate--beta-alanine ligase